MSNIIKFIPKSKKYAKQNLKKFIQLCKDELTVFNTEDYTVDWNNYHLKGINFTKLGTHSNGHTSNDALDVAYINFAKAYFRHQQGIHPTGTRNEQKAIVLIEKAYIEKNLTPDIITLNEDILDDAVEIARAYYKPGAAYQAGRELQILAEFINEKNIAAKPIDWINSIKRPADKNKTGRKAKQDREKKLPDSDGVNAIAEIYANKPKSHQDIYATSTFVLLMQAPSRITEVHELPVLCDEIPEEYLGYIDESGNKSTGYGVRFRAGKEYDPEIKWVPTVLQDLAKGALQRIKEITQPARDFAKMLEEMLDKNSENFGKFPRHL